MSADHASFSNADVRQHYRPDPEKASFAYLNDRVVISDQIANFESKRHIVERMRRIHNRAEGCYRYIRPNRDPVVTDDMYILLYVDAVTYLQEWRSLPIRNDLKPHTIPDTDATSDLHILWILDRGRAYQQRPRSKATEDTRVIEHADESRRQIAKEIQLLMEWPVQQPLQL